MEDYLLALGIVGNVIAVVNAAILIQEMWKMWHRGEEGEEVYRSTVPYAVAAVNLMAWAVYGDFSKLPYILAALFIAYLWYLGANHVIGFALVFLLRLLHDSLEGDFRQNFQAEMLPKWCGTLEMLYFALLLPKYHIAGYRPKILYTAITVGGFLIVRFFYENIDGSEEIIMLMTSMLDCFTRVLYESRRVRRARLAECVMSTLTGAVWFTYGVLASDPMIWLPHILWFALGVQQFRIFFRGELKTLMISEDTGLKQHEESVGSLNLNCGG